MIAPQVGDRIHGYAGGVFGRDSYTCRTVTTVGDDWIVTRNDDGRPEFVTLAAIEQIDPDDRSWCGDDCEPPA